MGTRDLIPQDEWDNGWGEGALGVSERSASFMCYNADLRAVILSHGFYVYSKQFFFGIRYFPSGMYTRRVCKSSANPAIVTRGLGPRVFRQTCTELF